MYVNQRFELNYSTVDRLQSMIPKFGYNGFGEIIFYRTYSRTMKDMEQESWADCVIRVTNGTFSIRKDFYMKNRILWDENFWQQYAAKFAYSMFRMQWLPPGRGLWAMGSNFVYERGAMALYNCAYTNIGNNETLSDDIVWLMDSLMHGVGVGFGPLRDDLTMYNPRGSVTYRIPDSREGWCIATKLMLDAFLHGGPLPKFDYSNVRPAGLPIKGFGGISSGPEPLMILHKKIQEQCERWEEHSDPVLFKTNIANLVGTCVVAGNVRRSAEIACGSVNDETFMDLKDYSLFPERAEWGWMSNNSCILDSDEDFSKLGEIARRVIKNGEPGFINKQNLRYGRIGKRKKKLREDEAVGFNPCGEIPLEHREVCNLSETLPTMCPSIDDWYKACEYATFYCSTVSLLPTHQEATNRVVARNRRIGVGIIDFTGWKHECGVHNVTRFLRNGYDIVRATNQWLNAEAGVPEAIRVTTVKPGGTTPKLPGKTSGIGHPTFHHTLRRFRVQVGTPFHSVLIKAGIPYEVDFYSQNTDCFEYPILQGPAKPAEEVSLWEQANNLVLMQREWSDNAVSNTLYFRPKWRLIEHWNLQGKGSGNVVTDIEEGLNQFIGHTTLSRLIRENGSTYIIPDQYKIILRFEECIKIVNSWNGEDHAMYSSGTVRQIVEVKIYEYDPRHEEDDVEPVLSSIAPLVKSVSLLPHSAKGVYKQMPEEGISEEEYNSRLAMISPIDWSDFRGSDGIDERYCTGDACEIQVLQ